jgi:hypothetical protein
MKRATLTITCEYADDANPDIIRAAMHNVASTAAGNGLLTEDGMLSLESWDADVEITDVADEPEDDGSGPRVVAMFQPQADQNGYCIDIDGAYTFDITAQIKKMGRTEALAIEDDQYGSDELWQAYVARHPDKDHDGPYRVIVQEAIEEYFEAIDQT